MARICRGDIEVEITDAALVVLVLGLAAAGLAALWLVTQNPATLVAVREIAER